MSEGLQPAADSEWEREHFVAQTDLAARFHSEGMVWLANRVLHPFGWAVGVVYDTEKETVIGFSLHHLLNDPEGILSMPEAEVEARARFFAALSDRPKTSAPPMPAAVVPKDEPPVCECGAKLWQLQDADGNITEFGCPNPRCDKYRTPRRR